MKISKSKQQLARIISENGGWRDCAESAAQCTGGEVSFWYDTATKASGENWCGSYLGRSHDIQPFGYKLPNWHQALLSRDEYFHLYPAPDADVAIVASFNPCVDGFEVGGVIAQHTDSLISESNVAQHTPRITAVTTIEQLAADYRNLIDFAERKQKEADDAKADADEALRRLEIAGEGIGLLVSPITAKQEAELVITDWLDLQAGDVISVSGKWWKQDSEYTVDENDGSSDAPIRVGGYWATIGECSFKFIRRP